jgi:hypothetical protein
VEKIMKNVSVPSLIVTEVPRCVFFPTRPVGSFMANEQASNGDRIGGQGPIFLCVSSALL